MEPHGAFPFLKEIILFLALSGVLIPLLARLRINPVLGFLAVGTWLGPYGLASLSAQWPWLSQGNCIYPRACSPNRDSL